MVRNDWRLLLLVCAAVLATAAGCGKKGRKLDLVPVTGKITLEGQPVEGATVTFSPKGKGNAAAAITGKDGTYRLKTFDQEGAEPGSYDVSVTKIDVQTTAVGATSVEDYQAAMTKGGAYVVPKPQSTLLLPAKYASPLSSELKAEVKKGQQNEFSFDLKKQ